MKIGKKKGLEGVRVGERVGCENRRARQAVKEVRRENRKE